MTDFQPTTNGNVLSEVSNALVALHKQQFGRGPTSARTNFAGRDTLVCVLEDALLPAERALVAMGEQQRVRESRSFFQAATAPRFVERIEAITGRTVHAFSSALDPNQGVAMEIFVFEPPAGREPE